MFSTMAPMVRLRCQTGWSATIAAGTSSKWSAWAPRTSIARRASPRIRSHMERGQSGWGSRPWPVTTATWTSWPSAARRAMVPPIPRVSSSAWGATTRMRRRSAEDIFRSHGEGSARLLDDECADREGVEAGGGEAADRVARGGHDGFALDVERGVEDDGHAGLALEGLEERVVARGSDRVDGLHA